MAGLRRLSPLRAYRQFHGHAPRKLTRTNFPYPRTLLLLGAAVAIEYESDKARFAGDKRIRARVYRHEVGPAVKLYTSENRRWVYIGGGRFRVTNWLRD